MKKISQLKISVGWPTPPGGLKSTNFRTAVKRDRQKNNYQLLWKEKWKLTYSSGKRRAKAEPILKKRTAKVFISKHDYIYSG